MSRVNALAVELIMATVHGQTDEANRIEAELQNIFEEKNMETVTADSLSDDLAAAIKARDEALEELRVMRADLAECEKQRVELVEETALLQDKITRIDTDRTLLREQRDQALEDLDEARRLALSNNAAFSNQQAVISHLVAALSELTQ